MSRFVINSVTLCNNFLSHFVIIISKLVKPLYLSHFVINIFKKPKKSIRSLLVTLCHKNYFCKEFRQYPFFSFQNSQERRETLQIVDAIVTWLFENFESLGKKLISKSFFHDLWHVSRQRFTLLHCPNLFLVRKIWVKNSSISWTNKHRISHLGIFLLFWGKFDPKKQNCLFKIELGTWSSLNTLFDGDVHFFLLKTENTLSGQIWSKKPKLLVKAEVWHLVYFEYVELDGLNYF